MAIKSIGREQGVLSDIQILRRIVATGDNKGSLLFLSPLIDPVEQLGPSSLDLRLGTKLKTIGKFSGTHIDLTEKQAFRSQRDRYFDEQSMDADGHFVLHPGDFALGYTLEYMRLPMDLAGRLEGRSSFGRIGLQVHATAGFVDPGFEGTLTFELMNSGTLPVRIAPGLRLGQICFFRVDDAQVSYMLKPNSKYGGKIDAELSRAHLDKEIPDGTKPVMEVRGELGPKDLSQLAALIPTGFESRIEFEGRAIPKRSDSQAVAEVAAVVGGVAAVTTLFVTILDKIKRAHQSSMWTKSRMEKVLENHLLMHGVHDYDIQDVSGFDGLQNKGGACAVRVVDRKKGGTYLITVFWDKDVYVTKVASQSD